MEAKISGVGDVILSLSRNSVLFFLYSNGHAGGVTLYSNGHHMKYDYRNFFENFVFQITNASLTIGASHLGGQVD